jgi:tripartite-type tricarboxylate transporter receptor subunit TctC
MEAMQRRTGRSCRHLSRWLLLLTALAFAAPVPADAQSGYPNKPVRILVPYGPGGVADTTARLLAQKLNDRLRQPFIIENRPGAGGILASQAGPRLHPTATR